MSERERETETETETETDRQTDRQTDRDRDTERETIVDNHDQRQVLLALGSDGHDGHQVES